MSYPISYGTLTIRRSTDQERTEKFPPLVRGRKRIKVPKWVVVSLEHNTIVSVFGLPQGGATKAETVFWAKRAASKNGFEYLPPSGWEKIEGELPKRKEKK